MEERISRRWWTSNQRGEGVNAVYRMLRATRIQESQVPSRIPFMYDQSILLDLYAKTSIADKTPLWFGHARNAYF
jgi:hypothetical protein